MPRPLVLRRHSRTPRSRARRDSLGEIVTAARPSNPAARSPRPATCQSPAMAARRPRSVSTPLPRHAWPARVSSRTSISTRLHRRRRREGGPPQPPSSLPRTVAGHGVRRRQSQAESAQCQDERKPLLDLELGSIHKTGLFFPLSQCLGSTADKHGCRLGSRGGERLIGEGRRRLTLPAAADGALPHSRPRGRCAASAASPPRRAASPNRAAHPARGAPSARARTRERRPAPAANTRRRSSPPSVAQIVDEYPPRALGL